MNNITIEKKYLFGLGLHVPNSQALGTFLHLAKLQQTNQATKAMQYLHLKSEVQQRLSCIFCE